MAGDIGRYAYAVCRGLTDSDVATVRGLRGVAVAVVPFRDLAAVVSDVPLAEFGEEPIHRHLEDLGWLESVAREHDAVVQQLAAQAPTAPLRLATIYRDDDAVRARLDEAYDGLRRALDRVTGCSEWSVKAYGAATPEAEPTPADALGEAGAGAAYLRRKQAQARARGAAQKETAAATQDIHGSLSAVSVASRRLPPQDPRLTGNPAPMLLNGTYLVEAESADAFAAVVRELDERHPAVELSLQGPWPPYSFATLDDA